MNRPQVREHFVRFRYATKYGTLREWRTTIYTTNEPGHFEPGTDPHSHDRVRDAAKKVFTGRGRILDTFITTKVLS